jgi:hypothetical protein
MINANKNNLKTQDKKQSKEFPSPHGLNGEEMRAAFDEHERISEKREDKPEDSTSEKRSYSLNPISELLQQPSAPDWLIRKYLAKNSLAMVFGEPGTYKSFLALGMGLSIASGIDWLGYSTKQGPVLYLCGEGLSGVSRRIKAWLLEHEASPEIPFFVSSGSISLSDDVDMSYLLKEVDRLQEVVGPPALIIIDTLSRHFSGNENTQEDMADFVRQIDQNLLCRGCSVLLVHHCGISDPSRGRGSSVLRGALDFEYSMTIEGDHLKFQHGKPPKDSEAPPPQYFRSKIIELAWTDPETGDPLTSCILQKAEAISPSHELSEFEDTAYNILNHLLKQNPTGVHFESWREGCYNSKISKSEKPEAKRQAFGRISKKLIDSGLVITNGKIVTIPEQNEPVI